MSGDLRGDLFQCMPDWEQKTDLCLALGSSLCGMNADRMVVTPAEKAALGVGLGTVVSLIIIDLTAPQPQPLRTHAAPVTLCALRTHAIPMRPP